MHIHLRTEEEIGAYITRPGNLRAILAAVPELQRSDEREAVKHNVAARRVAISAMFKSKAFRGTKGSILKAVTELQEPRHYKPKHVQQVGRALTEGSGRLFSTILSLNPLKLRGITVEERGKVIHMLRNIATYLQLDGDELTKKYTSN